MNADKRDSNSLFIIRVHLRLRRFGGYGVIRDVLFGIGFGEEARSYGHRDCGEVWRQVAGAASGAGGSGYAVYRSRGAGPGDRGSDWAMRGGGWDWSGRAGSGGAAPGGPRVRDYGGYDHGR